MNHIPPTAIVVQMSSLVTRSSTGAAAPSTTGAEM